MQCVTSVDDYIANTNNWQDELARLREILCSTPLTEEVKWGATAAFRSLTPGRQREYSEYVASAKRDATKQSRIEKILPMITAGIGLNDRYRR